jgi:hypothetical protein
MLKNGVAPEIIEEFARVSPIAWTHLLFTGRYSFKKNSGNIDIEAMAKMLEQSFWRNQFRFVIFEGSSVGPLIFQSNSRTFFSVLKLSTLFLIISLVSAGSLMALSEKVEWVLSDVMSSTAPTLKSL